MQVKRVPAATGWRWVVQGAGLLRRHPLPLIGLMVLFFFSVALPTVLPLIGQFASIALMPALSLGFMQAVRTAESGRMPSPWLLYDGLRAQGGRGAIPLLQLGLINCVLTFGALALSALADGGALFRLFNGALSPEDPALRDSGMVLAALVFLLLYLPVQMAMWYAPMFVGWHRASPPRALFYSWVCVWRNKAAFTVYGLGWFVVLVSLSILVRIAGTVLPAAMLPILLSLVSIALLSAIYCSFWPTYRDVVLDGPEAPPVSPVA
jgi:hypothetical protein